MKEQIFIAQENFDKKQFQDFILVGDIGGTNCRLGVIGKSSSYQLIFSFNYESKQLNHIYHAINETLKEAKSRYDVEIKDCCLALAGPVLPKRDFCQFTNLSWNVDAKEILSNTFLQSVSLINDFEAIGYGIPLMKNDQLILLQHPNSSPSSQQKATKAIIGAGTGLGKAILTFNEQKQNYVPVASEGGHADFPITEEIEQELVRWWKRQNNTEKHPDYEVFLSGPGLFTIYSFLRSIHFDKGNRYTQEIDVAEDKPSVISEHVTNDRTCKKAMGMFLHIYSKAARNFALETVSRGGIYLAGGIAPKIIQFITNSKFMEEFENNIAMKQLLEQIPVFVVTEENIGLFGAANVSLNFKELSIKK